MNIFALDDDPTAAARSLCDQHLGKMLLEAAQLLCGAQGQEGPIEASLREWWLIAAPVERLQLNLLPYKRTHVNHPCAVWTRRRAGNYCWLAAHGEALAQENIHRFGKPHSSAAVVAWCSERAALVDFAESDHQRTPFAQAMPEQYRGDDAVAAYRRYYTAEKMILRGKPVTWTRRERPAWLLEKI